MGIGAAVDDLVQAEPGNDEEDPRAEVLFGRGLADAELALVLARQETVLAITRSFASAPTLEACYNDIYVVDIDATDASGVFPFSR